MPRPTHLFTVGVYPGIGWFTSLITVVTETQQVSFISKATILVELQKLQTLKNR